MTEMFENHDWPEGWKFDLDGPPPLESWDAKDHPSQVRVSRFKDAIEAAAASALAGSDSGLALALSVGLGPDQDILRDRDLDNFLTPVVTALGRNRFVSVWAEKHTGAGSFLVIGQPREMDRGKLLGYSHASATTRCSTQGEEWKRSVHDQIGHHPSAAEDGPLEVLVVYRCGPRRSWINLWKPTLDALEGICGTDGSRKWHPRDDRIVRLGLSLEVDPSLGNDVSLGLWWRPAGEDRGSGASSLAASDPAGLDRLPETENDWSMTTGRFHKIRALRVAGGFLDGLDVGFDPRLNCVIGGRGSGKTTVVEFMRFALDAMPGPDRPQTQTRGIQQLLKGNLTPQGRITVEIETRDGLVYLVERSLADDSPEILDEKGKPTNLTLDHGSFFGVEVYSQNEIEDIANRPKFQLDLIDTFIEADIRELEQQIGALERDLGANGAEIVRLEGEIEALASGVSELDVVVEKLKAFQSEGGEEADAYNREVELKGLRDRESRVVEAVEQRLTSERVAIQRLAERLAQGGGGAIPEEVLEGPNNEVFEHLGETASGAIEEVHGLLTRAAEKIEEATREIADARADLGERHREQEVRYRELAEKHEKEAGRARERDKLQQRRNILTDQKQKLAECREARAALLDERVGYLRRLAELRNQRTALRTEVAADLTRKLGPDIRVSITQHGEQSAYVDLLLEAFSGSGRQYRRLVDKITRTLPPPLLARLVGENEPGALVERLDAKADQADLILDRLRGTETIYQIEAVDLDDVPRIELKDGPDYKDSRSLSTGQKCTTILPILLLESEKPLLIDQPEDNLDNAFIYDTVVRKLRDLKKHRQLIFVTHNPNIPVLGDAGQVIVMNSTGRHASVEATGTVDEQKRRIATILEGGEEAFQERRKRYGY